VARAAISSKFRTVSPSREEREEEFQKRCRAFYPACDGARYIFRPRGAKCDVVSSARPKDEPDPVVVGGPSDCLIHYIIIMTAMVASKAANVEAGDMAWVSLCGFFSFSPERLQPLTAYY
jgi:hypothetical protein